MNKLVGYTVLVLGTIGFLLIYGLVKPGMKDIIYEKNGLQFENLTKQEAINPTNESFYFLSKANNNLTFYHYPGHRNTGNKIDLSVLNTKDSTENLHSLSIEAANGNMDYTEYLRDLDQREMAVLLSRIDGFQGMKLSQYTYENGWFGYIDDTPIIFIFIGFILFILCLIINSLLHILGRRFGSSIRWLVSGILILGLTFIAVKGNWWIWFPYSQTLNTIRKIATIILPYLLYMFVINRSSDLDFADREVLKFFTIILGTYAIGFIISQVGFAYDSSIDSNVVMVENHGPHPLIIGFSIAFATGNILANLVIHMIKMRGSEKILKKTELALGTSSANMQSLQSTINPHFLYNSLNSIASTAKVDGEKTEKMALALSSFYKYITNKSDENVTTLSEEIEMLDNYLKIEKIRFDEVLTVDLDIDDNATECILPRLLLQPLLENAIKYGYSENGINVQLTANKVEDQLVIRIYDSGPDFGSDMQIGFGIKSVTQKLNMLYPDSHTIEFNNKPTKHILIEISQNITI